MASDFKSLSEMIQTNAPALPITDASPELVKEIQAILKMEVDGIVGSMTKQAFADFKEYYNLENPLFLGVTTAKQLLALRVSQEKIDPIIR